MTKVCVRCNEEKDIGLFAKGKNYKDGRRGTCKKCHTAYVINYYNNNPDKKAAKNKMNTFYRPPYKRHGITKEMYDKLFMLHDGKCHVCKSKNISCIDHDHSCCSNKYSCGKCIRGLLCTQCNTALGLLQENVQTIKNLLKYIQ